MYKPAKKSKTKDYIGMYVDFPVQLTKFMVHSNFTNHLRKGQLGLYNFFAKTEDRC